MLVHYLCILHVCRVINIDSLSHMLVDAYNSSTFTSTDQQVAAMVGSVMGASVGVTTGGVVCEIPKVSCTLWIAPWPGMCIGWLMRPDRRCRGCYTRIRRTRAEKVGFTQYVDASASFGAAMGASDRSVAIRPTF